MVDSQWLAGSAGDRNKANAVLPYLRENKFLFTDFPFNFLNSETAELDHTEDCKQSHAALDAVQLVE